MMATVYKDRCPKCGSENLRQVTFDADVPEYICRDCGHRFKGQFSNTAPR